MMLALGLTAFAATVLVPAMTSSGRPWGRRQPRDAASIPLGFGTATPAAEWNATAPTAFRKRFPSGTTVLVIDDDAEIRDVTEILLRKHGLEVLTAADGEEGVEVFREHADRVRAVLLDMTMPGMSGADVSRAIREMRPDARIILSSGFCEEISREDLGRVPTVEFLQKPYTVETLISKIDAAISVRF